MSGDADIRAGKLVVLLTDFGTRDGYVAAMKGRILMECPDAIVIDAAHDVPPHDIHHGAWVLGQYWNWFPAGTIHVAVVDPGVGGARDIVVCVADGRIILAPDNGLLTWVVSAASRVRTLILRPDFVTEVSPTFHGRDIFAVAAGRFASGRVEVDAAGEETSSIYLLPDTQPSRRGNQIHGKVIHVDRFGNLITNIRSSGIATARQGIRILCRGYKIERICRTYADASRGELVALVGSSGMLEIAVREGSAAEELDAGCGEEVIVQLAGTEKGSEGCA
ncbi:MAG: hypothetical protein DRP22_01590 [Verrucomicrobia bacterium]|nr:MAG: hypothetical protein DRP22_01590 [Verrucomicrobiota bacterium]